MKLVRGICGVSVGALILGSVGASAAFAQDALDDIVVTAQKREEREQSIPISIAVLGAAEVERRAITNVGDLAGTVPNIQVAPFGVSPTTLRFYIRGLGPSDSQVTQDPPVGIYINGVYIARPVALSLDIPNIERIEVLRGPQGTLYGRNTTGGAINVITRRPDDVLGFSQLLSYGNYDAIRSQTTLNLPVSDNFFVGAAFSLSRRDGWLENTGVGPDFSFLNSKAGRIDARWLPVDGVTVDYSYDHARTRYTGDYFHLTVPAGPDALVPGLPAQTRRLKQASLLEPYRPGSDKAFGHTLTIAVETPVGELKSITAYRRTRANAYNDFSGNPFATIFLNRSLSVRQRQFSQELQLVGATESNSVSYVTGVYYFRERAHEVATDQFFTFPLPRDITARNRSAAAYGQLTLRPGGDAPWSLTAGLRYTRDRRSGDNTILPVATRTDHKLTASLTADYRFGENAMIYAKVVQGYKAGGFNMRQAAFDQSFAPEKLISYEAGLKSEWFGRRMRFNLAGFYMDYDDIQLDIVVPDQPDPTLTRTTNAGKARIMGLEVDVQLLVADGLRLSAGYGLTDNKIQRVVGDDASLYTLPYASKHTLTGTIDWDIVKTDAGTLNLSVDGYSRTHFVSNARYLPFRRIPGYELANARLSFSGDDWLIRGAKVTVAGWVRNLFDKEYAKESFSSFSGVHASRLTTYGLPRTYGLELKVDY